MCWTQLQERKQLHKGKQAADWTIELDKGEQIEDFWDSLAVAWKSGGMTDTSQLLSDGFPVAQSEDVRMKAGKDDNKLGMLSTTLHAEMYDFVVKREKSGVNC